MHTIDPPVPSRHDVRAALLWALEYDREALLEHRETTQNRRWDTARRRADRQIVRRWRASELSHTPSTLTPAGMAASVGHPSAMSRPSHIDPSPA